MSENSPRWPGANGSPGLDFSPYRKPAEPADVQVDEPADSGDSGADSAHDPDATQTHEPVADAPARSADPVSEPGGFTPKLSERVASTVKEWAAVPVAGITRAASGAGAPVSQATPSRAVDPAGEAAGATAVGADGTPKEKPVRAARRTRKARLRLSRIDPWSVMKTTFLFAIAFGVMMLVATFVVWSVLSGSGAIEATDQFIETLIGSETGDVMFSVKTFLDLNRVMGFTAVVAAIDVVIITALATLAAFLYNLAATIMGGLEVTLAED